MHWDSIAMQTDVEFRPENQAKARCFGAKAALTVEATQLIHKGVPSGWTVNLDVAPRQGESIQWNRKITVQLSDTELPLLAAVCLGYLPKVSFKRPTKGISVERQANKLFISATQGSGAAFALPVPIAQTFQVGVLVLAQLKKQSPLDDGELIIAALRGAAALYSAAQQ